MSSKKENSIAVMYHVPGQPPIEQHGNWFDLSTACEVVCTKDTYTPISLGVSIKLPDNYEAYIIPRSSTFSRYGILQANSLGLIDSDYCGPLDIWQFPAYCVRDCIIPKFTRICQFRIHKVMPDIKIVCEDLSFPSRGGFGSSGF